MRYATATYTKKRQQKLISFWRCPIVKLLGVTDSKQELGEANPTGTQFICSDGNIMESAAAAAVAPYSPLILLLKK